MAMAGLHEETTAPNHPKPSVGPTTTHIPNLPNYSAFVGPDFRRFRRTIRSRLDAIGLCELVDGMEAFHRAPLRNLSGGEIESALEGVFGQNCTLPIATRILVKGQKLYRARNSSQLFALPTLRPSRRIVALC